MSSENSAIVSPGESDVSKNRSNDMKQERDDVSDLKERFISLERPLKTLQNDGKTNNLQIVSCHGGVKENRIYPWSGKIQEALKNVFKLTEFRTHQRSIIDSVLCRKSQLIVMPPGGGKSLLYQLPAYIENGFTVVVTPVISLINDQLRLMEEIKLKSATLNGFTSYIDKSIIFAQMLDRKSDLKLIYVKANYLSDQTFITTLKAAAKADRFKRIVIDEAHCCSNRGHNYLLDYRNLGKLRSIFPNIPILGLTATTTINISADILKTLRIYSCNTFLYNRPNRYYKTIYKSPFENESFVQICNLLQNYRNERGIIFCNTVPESIDLAKALKNRGFKSAFLPNGNRVDIYNKWLSKQYLIVVTTEIFGIGINVPDVRFVIHYFVPRTVANLYQETGRAGRDGHRADCILMYNLFDSLNVAKNWNLQATYKHYSFLKMLNYCLIEDCCRRRLMFNDREEVWREGDQCERMCDYCEQSTTIDFKSVDITNYCNDINLILCNEKLTLPEVLNLWFNGRFSPDLSRENAEFVIAHLINRKYLRILLTKDACYITKGPNVQERIIIRTSRLFDLGGKRDNYGCGCGCAKKMKVIVSNNSV